MLCLRRSEMSAVDLNQRAERFRQLSEASIDGIVFHRAGVILDANDRFAAMFGYNLGEIVGRAIETLTHQGYWLDIPSDFSNSFSEKVEAVGRRKDGTTFMEEITSKIGRASCRERV